MASFEFQIRGTERYYTFSRDAKGATDYSKEIEATAADYKPGSWNGVYKTRNKASLSTVDKQLCALAGIPVDPKHYSFMYALFVEYAFAGAFNRDEGTYDEDGTMGQGLADWICRKVGQWLADNKDANLQDYYSVWYFCEATRFIARNYAFHCWR
jgi:hypothetical protein